MKKPKKNKPAQVAPTENEIKEAARELVKGDMRNNALMAMLGTRQADWGVIKIIAGNSDSIYLKDSDAFIDLGKELHNLFAVVNVVGNGKEELPYFTDKNIINLYNIVFESMETLITIRNDDKLNKALIKACQDYISNNTENNTVKNRARDFAARTVEELWNFVNNVNKSGITNYISQQVTLGKQQEAQAKQEAIAKLLSDKQEKGLQ